MMSKVGSRIKLLRFTGNICLCFHEKGFNEGGRIEFMNMNIYMLFFLEGFGGRSGLSSEVYMEAGSTGDALPLEARLPVQGSVIIPRCLEVQTIVNGLDSLADRWWRVLDGYLFYSRFMYCLFICIMYIQRLFMFSYL